MSPGPRGEKRPADVIGPGKRGPYKKRIAAWLGSSFRGPKSGMLGPPWPSG
jgi:hypothetical protein